MEVEGHSTGVGEQEEIALFMVISQSYDKGGSR